MVVSVVIHRSRKPGLSSGYSIRLFEGNGEIASYSAGGHFCDSHAPGESPLRILRRWAISTAKELFAEHAGRSPTAQEMEVEIESLDEE